MKDLSIYLRRLLLVILVVGASVASVRGEVMFQVVPVEVEGDVTVEAAKVIFRKCEQIMTRNSAAAAGAADVFGVRAKLTLTGEAKTSGMVRDITSASGELSLIAFNKVDNAKYYSVTVPLNAAIKGGGEGAAVLALANSIKPTDAVFTRFVRVAREKVEEYYSEHCEEVIERAKALGLSGQYATAMVYLTGMPSFAPCHEDALELIAGLRSKIDTKIEEAEEKAERRRQEQAEKDKKSDSDDSGDDSDSDGSGKSSGSDDSGKSSAPKDKPASASGSLGDLYVQSPSWNCRISEATYLPQSRKIKIVAYVTYVGKKPLTNDCPLGFRQALDQDGDAYDTCYVSGSSYRSFPEDVPVKIEYFIDNVRSNPGKLSFVGLSVDYQKIEIKNLPISE